MNVYHRIMRQCFVPFFIAVWMPLASAQIYVAPTGNDLSGNGTAGNPYATVGKGVQQLNLAAPGTDLLIAPGSYVESASRIVTLSGTAGNPVEIRGNGGTPLLLEQWLVLSGVSHVAVSNLNIDAQLVRPGCLYYRNASDCTAVNCILNGGTSDAAPVAEAQSLGLIARGGAGDAGNLAISGCQRLYFNNVSVPDSTASTWFTVADSAVQNASVIFEDCSFFETDGGSTAAGTSNGFRMFSGIDGLVLRNCVLSSWTYTMTLDIRTGPPANLSLGLLNRYIIEDSTVMCRNVGANNPCLIVTEAANTSNNFIFRNSLLTSRGGVTVVMAENGTAQPVFSGWLFDNCTLRSNDDYTPLAVGPGANGIIRYQDMTVARNFTFRNCRFIGALAVRGRSDTTQDTGGWTFENCIGETYIQTIFLRFAKCPNWTFRNCNFTTLISSLYLDGQLADSLIEDCTFVVLDSTQVLLGGAAAVSLGEAETTTNALVMQNVTMRRCAMISAKSAIPAFNMGDNGFNGLTMEDCFISSPGEGIHAPGLTGRTQANLVIDGCYVFSASDGITVEQTASGAILRNNVVQNVGAGFSGIRVLAGSVPATSDVTIENNYLSNLGGLAMLVEGASHAVRGNTIVNCADGIRLNYGAQNNYSDMLVTRNCIYGNASPAAGSIGIELNNPFFSPTANLTLTNNTILSWQNGILLGGANVQGVKAYNNILFGNSGTGLVAAGSGNAYSFNGYHNNGTNAAGTTLPGNGDVLADPQFLSTTPADPNFLKLGPSSPMIDMGSLDGVNPDLGAPGGDEIDIGCIESGVSSVSTWRML